MRVVSLLPSATEMLLAITGPDALSLDNRVRFVGRSHECDWPAPPAMKHVPVLTSARTKFTTSSDIDRQVREQLSTGESLYTLNADLLADLEPDLILTQDLCSVCSIDLSAVQRAVEQCALRQYDPPAVLSFNPQTVEGVLDDILALGRAIEEEPAALAAVVRLRERMDRAEAYVSPFAQRVNVAFLEWTDPVFVGGHWTPQLIERAGGEHPLNPTRATEHSGAAAGPVGQTQRAAGKSIQVSPADIVASRPEVVILCPCGLSLKQGIAEARALAQQEWLQELPAVRNGRIAVVDGNQMFNRPGPRLVDALEFLVGFLNDRPELIPEGFPWQPFVR
ncbi:MAG: ABC transporter substrate-binding protein [Phycisphaerales bacterium]|nr:ABC transporter substrate-binding protein [Phycisphaerales bacterium]